MLKKWAVAFSFQRLFRHVSKSCFSWFGSGIRFWEFLYACALMPLQFAVQWLLNAFDLLRQGDFLCVHVRCCYLLRVAIQCFFRAIELLRPCFCLVFFFFSFFSQFFHNVAFFFLPSSAPKSSLRGSTCCVPTAVQVVSLRDSEELEASQRRQGEKFSSERTFKETWWIEWDVRRKGCEQEEVSRQRDVKKEWWQGKTCHEKWCEEKHMPNTTDDRNLRCQKKISRTKDVKEQGMSKELDDTNRW